VHETEADLLALQELLDRSYEQAGRHLRSIITPARRVPARELAKRLQGMVLLTLATVSADGHPLAGPVDGIFYPGSFHFGSSPDSVRFRHIRRRPHVSATHLPGEDFAVSVHGRALELDLRAAANTGLRSTLIGVYVPRYGPGWETFLDSGPVYARIEAASMFSFSMGDEPGNEPDGAQ
jgi:Pyridoxamine 5'-phosphate oxidase